MKMGIWPHRGAIATDLAGCVPTVPNWSLWSSASQAQPVCVVRRGKPASSKIDMKARSPDQRRRHHCWVALQVSVVVPPVQEGTGGGIHEMAKVAEVVVTAATLHEKDTQPDRKSTRLNSSHLGISY